MVKLFLGCYLWDWKNFEYPKIDNINFSISFCAFLINVNRLAPNNPNITDAELKKSLNLFQ